MEYNGWKNKETWVINLHIGNNENLSQHWDLMASTLKGVKDDKYKLAEMLLEYFNELRDEFCDRKTFEGLLFRDLIYLDTVDWETIAERLLEE